MTEAEADDVLRRLIDAGPRIRLAEEVLQGCQASETTQGRRGDIHIEADFRARAGKVRSARVGVKRDS